MSTSDTDPAGWATFLEKLYGQSKFGIDLGLERMRRALAKEAHPQREAPCLVIAGTNGKGGTAAFLGSILQAHGLRVGLYTSPHILDCRERFRVDGQPLPAAAVLREGSRILAEYGEGGPEDPRLTFFELTTLMALCLFRDSDLDVYVLEVGLGGRLDAVNAVEPAVSVITTIGLDHGEYLGDTLPEVAAEKAGILREGVPAVVGAQRHSEVYEVLEARGAHPLYRWGRDFELTSDGRGVRLGERVVDGLEPLEPHRTRLLNMATALQASAAHLEGAFGEDAARRGVRHTRWPGRMDRRVVPATLFGTDRPIPLLLDGAHNPQAADALFAHLQEASIDPGAVVVSGLADKALEGLFAPLDRPPHSPVFPAVLDAKRAADAATITEALPVPPRQPPAPTTEALGAACRHLDAAHPTGQPLPPLLVYGSIYLIGECFETLDFGVEDLSTWAAAGDIPAR